MNRIKVSRILAGALATVLEHRVRLSYALAGPAGIFVLMGFIPQDPEAISGALVLLTAATTAFLHTIVAISTHRIVILGPDSVPKWGITSWSLRETRFLLYLFGVAFGVAMLASFAVLLPQPIGLALMAGVAIVMFSALSLVFPAVALEHPISLQQAWAMAQGNFFPLIVCVWVFPICMVLPVVALSLIPYTQPLTAILQLAANVLTVAALSLAYSEITKDSPVWKS